MMTSEDMKRIMPDDLAMRRIKRAEKACREAQNNDWKKFWYNTFKKLCEKYDKMAYFNRTIN
tara:strand:+ start:299 stop:484 length:186 start_codon:yes stop_codon:yes gene_type:complete